MVRAEGGRDNPDPDRPCGEDSDPEIEPEVARFRTPAMRPILLPILLILPSCAPAQPLPEAQDITAFVRRAMDELDVVPGVSVAVVRGDEIVYEEGFGYRDLERGAPVTPRTVFYTASLAKSFTAMTAAVLATRGEMDLDAPLPRYFPGLVLRPPLSADSVTVRDLLRHAKGFTNSTVNYRTTWVGPMSDAELLRVLREYSTPADGFIYSNTNFALAGYAIGRAAGEPWQDAMARAVFGPVGMERSTARLSEVAPDEMAEPYLATKDGFRRIPMLKTDSTITGAGGIFSTAHDLARFVIANLNEGRVEGRQALPASAVAETQTPQVELEARFFAFDRYAYGLGFYLADFDGDLLIHHFGGFPGYRSHLSFMPERGLGVVVLQNEGIDGNRFADLVATYVYDTLLGKPDADERAGRRIAEIRTNVQEARRNREEGWQGQLDRLRAGPVTPSLPLDAYEGVYESERLGRIRLELAGDRLNAAFGALRAPALAAGGNDFLVAWIPGNPPDGFTFDVEGGRVTGFHWGARPFVRVK